MSRIDATGFNITSLSERYSALQTLMQNIFGADINLDPNSYDGQLIGMLAESINNLDQLAQAVYACFNPNTATGNALSLLVKLNYLTRQEGAFSTVPIKFSGTVGTPIPKNTIYKSNDGSGNEWIVQTAVTIGTDGTVIAQAQASVMGPLAAPIGTVTEPLTPIYGVDAATNEVAASLGALEETDEQLRIRRALSTATNGVGSLDSIRGTMLQVAGVTQARVYENFTDTTDSNGQAPHSVHAIVVGGANQDILNVMWFKKPAGIDVVGSITGPVVDTSGWPHTMAYDRPTSTPIYIIANVKMRAGFPADGTARIKAALVAWAQTYQKIGDPVIQSELYAPLMASVFNTGSILSLYIGLSASPTTTTDLTIAYDHIAEFDPSLITVVLT